MTVGNDVQVKYVYASEAMVTVIPPSADLITMQRQVRELCRFSPEMNFTLKWIDEEQDPCVISSDLELREAFRLYYINNEAHLHIHVIPGVPESPGKLCPGEDLHMYRRGAKRWKKKYYLFFGHKFAARRFNRNARCFFCDGRIWGLGRQGFKCITCGLLLHRQCRIHVHHKCGEQPMIGNRVVTVPSTLPGGLVGDSQPYDQVSRPDVPASQTVYEDALGNANAEGQRNAAFQDSMRHAPPEFSQTRHFTPAVVPVEGKIDEIPDIQSISGRLSLQDFTLLKVIGRGSFAKVFQVEHKLTGRIYAMKVIKKETLTDVEDFEWVQTEKHVFECATNHPFLVGLHSCFQSPSRLFFVIEFVNGGDLMYYMQQHLRMPEEYARFYSAEICIALNFLHERGIIYRDLKLDNVLMDSEGHIKLTDYGMCKEGITGDLTTTTFCGTPNYIAPEILQREPYSFSVDWWALGVLMFEMLAGRPPWEGVGQAGNSSENAEKYLFQVILTRPIRFPRSISVPATNILRAFLNKNPTERLGCPPDSNFADIMAHAFFRPVDWIAMEQKQIPPPYRPAHAGDLDLTHFDPTFTEEPVVFTPDDEKLITAIDQTEFEGFEYVNPLLMSLEEPV